jgi:uncharacterized protein YjdB
VFDAATTSYVVTVPNTTGSVIVALTATAADVSSTIAWTPDAKSVSVAAGEEKTVSAKVTAAGGVEKTYTVTVKHEAAPVTSVTLNYTTYPLTTAGGSNTVQLIATVLPTNATINTVTWSSSDATKATVSDAGLVTAVASGEATITVTTTDGGKTATCVITVLNSGTASTPGDTGLAIGFGGFTESAIDLTKSSAYDISKSGSGSITVSLPDSTENVQWYVDGVRDYSSGTQFTVNASSYSIGEHKLTATFTVNEGTEDVPVPVPYSKEVSFRIVE